MVIVEAGTDWLHLAIFPVDFKEAGDIIDDELYKALVQNLPTGCRLTAIFDVRLAFHIPVSCIHSQCVSFRSRAIREPCSTYLTLCVHLSLGLDRGYLIDVWGHGIALCPWSTSEYEACVEEGEGERYGAKRRCCEWPYTPRVILWEC